MAIRREVFEYYFDSEDLEPFYSELAEGDRMPDTNNPRQHPVRPPSRNSCDESRTNAGAMEAAGFDATTEESRAPTDSTIAVRACEMREADRANSSDDTAGDRDPEPSPSTQSPRSGEPWGRTRVRDFVSVHALGQNAYCTRSAILSLETGHEAEIDEPMPRLTYLPNFERERIEEALSRHLRSFGVSLIYSLCLIGITLFGAFRQDKVTYYLAGVVFVGNLYWLTTLLSNIVVLIARRRAAINAEANEPDPQVVGIQRVNWWSLIKAGYEITNYKQAFRHPELPIEGCPWRVLERGSIKIPVIRTGGETLGDRPGELYVKHQVRLTAYAMLLESIGHVEVPFGVVVPADSPNGLAMAITPALRERAIRFLGNFVTKLEDSRDHDIEPRIPENRNRCANCQYGEPAEIKAWKITSLRSEGTRLLVMSNGNGKSYHCECGDRFGSAPPHSGSVRLGLTASLD